MLCKMIREIKVFSDWFGCVLVISFHTVNVFSESVTQSTQLTKLPAILSHQHRTTVSLETYTLYSFKIQVC